MNISTRILLAFVLSIGVGFYLLIKWVTDEVKPRYRESVEEALVDTAEILAALSTKHFSDLEFDKANFQDSFNSLDSRALFAKIYDVNKTSVDLRVYITNAEGRVVFDSDSGKAEGEDYSKWNDVYKTLKGSYGARTTRRDPNDPTSTILYIAAPVIANGKIIGSLTVCKPTDITNVFIQNAKQKIVVAGLIAAMLTLVFSLLASFWISKPVTELTNYARDIKLGKRRSLPKLAGSEMSELGQAFEEMKDELEGKNYVEQYIQTLTHEIKSPLSAILGAAELLDEDMPKEKQAEFIDNIQIESGRIQNIVDRLLELAQLESKKKLDEISTIEIAKVIEDAISGISSLVEKRELKLETTVEKDLFLKGNFFLLRQAIRNVVQNAIEFSKPKSTIQINVSKPGNHLQVDIVNTGEQIPEYAKDRLFERFYSMPRPHTSKKSTGLGLSFVKEVVELHDGEIALENLNSQQVRARINLPAL